MHVSFLTALFPHAELTPEAANFAYYSAYRYSFFMK